MNRTTIEWCQNPDGSLGYTWNPITGCLNGCSYCYARKLAEGRLWSRYRANQDVAPLYTGDGYYRNEASTMAAFYPRFWERKVLDITTRRIRMRRRDPRGVFVCNMADLFGPWIPDIWIERVMEAIKARPEWRFYLLTKQPQNLAKWSPFPDNCWVGVSATGYWDYVSACNYLSLIEAKVKYVSLEPLLSWDSDASYFFGCSGINWVIIGAQTKPYIAPKVEWVREIVDAADSAGIPVFLKDSLASPRICWEGGPPYYRREIGTWVLRQEFPKGV